MTLTFTARPSIENARRCIGAAPAVRRRAVNGLLMSALVAATQFGCAEEAPADKGNTVQLGTLLPYTGQEAALGRNIEQAMLLAIEDLNAAGGLDGKDFELVARDSHSGTSRGVSELLELLYTDEVEYLIGPEENDLANEIVQDVKALNIFNMLPGYAAPKIERISSKGAWMRLAPSPFAVGCGMAKKAIADGADSMNTLASLEDYNLALASEASTQFGHFGGRNLPSVTVESGANSYKRSLDNVFDYEADRTMLIAYPATAAAVVTEWSVSGKRGDWYLSPLLRTEAFLLNVPFGSLDKYHGLSPSLSLPSECAGLDGEQGAVECTRKNARRFSDHFAERWDGDRPFPASLLYYDAVVLLGLGLTYGLATEEEVPSAARLQRIIRSLNVDENKAAHWHSLGGALSKLADGTALRYVGAGAEYSFDQYGAAKHIVFDTWTIKDQAFKSTGTFYAECTPTL